ncbi:lactonase family protein [Legionella sp. 16cNR16C]|uniref:lactonase family protein n=1 Tax=Legionella sp. 16cNR16C TaxID=2905656 RepID=UPI001E4EB033|nr:lactonase family protein [Legionella sp. 16cNR16C]MCE3046466.1 lactonase family protein [Legionella sp. 16cNR16C]
MMQIKRSYFSQLLKLSLVFLIFIHTSYADKENSLTLEAEDQAEALLAVKLENAYCYGKYNYHACLNLIAGSNTPVVLTIANRSTRVTAYGIQAVLPVNMGVTQDASSCAILPPLASCTLRFLPGMNSYPQVSVPIIGTNAATTYVTMEVLPPTTLSIAVAGSPLVIPKGDNRSLTITNTSNFNAFAIHSDFTGTALDGQVVESGNTCAVVAPGANCMITYTAINTVVPPTNFPIFGTNTLAVNAVISVTSPFAYVTNNVPSGNITQCLRNSVTGELSNCSVMGPFPAINNPSNIVFNQTDTLAYISSSSSNAVTQCSVTPITGTLTNCTDSVIGGLTNSSGLTLNPTGSFLYILNSSGATPLIKCPIDGVGMIVTAGCVNSGATPPAGQVHSGITFNAAGTRAYLVNQFQTTICNVDGTGQLIGCVNPPSAAITFANGSMAFFNNESFAYVAVTSLNSVARCVVLNTGMLTSCFTAGGAVTNPQNIAIDEANSLIYISDNTSVSKCRIDPVTGNFFDCMDSGATNLNSPDGISLN